MNYQNENEKAEARVERALSINGIVDPMWNENGDLEPEARLTSLEKHYLRSRGVTALGHLIDLAYNYRGEGPEIAAHVLAVVFDKNKNKLDLNMIRGESLSMASDIFAVLQMETLAPERLVTEYFTKGESTFRKIFKKFDIEIDELLC